MGSKGSTTTTTSELPEWLKPYQSGALDNAWNQIGAQSPDNLQSPYGNVAPQNQAQLTAQNMIAGRALSGSPLTMAAQSYATNQLENGAGADPFASIRSPFLNQNPYTDLVANQVKDKMTSAYNTITAPSRDALAARMGGFGSSANQAQQQRDETALMSDIGNKMNEIYSGDYENRAGRYENYLNRASQSYNQSLGNQAQLLGLANGLANQDYYDANQLLGVGNNQFQYGQTVLNGLNSNFQNAVNFPMTQADQYLAAIRGAAGNSGQSTVTGGNNGMGLLGGLLGLGSMFI